MPHFLIAEDHSVVRMGVIMLIREMYPTADIAEAETFDDVIRMLPRQRYDVLLLDIHMPGGDNIQMIDATRLRQPDIAILVFSSYDELLYAPGYLKAGADGYLSKKSQPEEMRTAIQKMLNGEKYISTPVQDMLLNDLRRPARGNGNGRKAAVLSDRETEVMNLLIKGATAKEIKLALNIQHSTVSTYKNRIFEKLKVSNVIELAHKIRISSSPSSNT
ncbi:response regulator transcription factor [Chitinophaga sp.]|uniref:response regulator transcription factor n=1 Tax=Chitinophaga sp. TaxID=1869181 RepID=UPI0031D90C87